MIDNILNGAKASLELYKNAGGEKPVTADAMFEALAVTLHASEYDNDTRLGCLFKLLMKCSTEWSRKQVVVDYTVALTAADYYFSVRKGLRAIPFLNRALEAYAQVTSTVACPVEDADRFLGQFRARNLKGKFSREYMAVKNLYILAGAAQKLGLEMAELDELPADHVPTLWAWRDMPFIIMLGIVGALMFLCPLEEYRDARLDGNPIQLLDTLQLTDIISVIIGLILISLEIGWLFSQYKPYYNRLMARIAYWKFSLKH